MSAEQQHGFTMMSQNDQQQFLTWKQNDQQQFMRWSQDDQQEFLGWQQDDQQAFLKQEREMTQDWQSYENEMQDLFGIKVSDLAIDYGGNFLRTKKIHPLADMFDPAAEKKAAAAKKAAAKKAAAGEGEKKTKDGQTIKTVPVSGVNCETAPDIDNPKPENE